VGVVEDMLSHQIDLLRVEAGARGEALALLTQLQNELIAALAKADLTALGKTRLTALLDETTNTINDYYAQLQDDAHAMLGGVAESTAKATADIIENAVAIDMTASLPTAAYLDRIVGNTLIMGAPSEEWWARQAQDTAFRFSNAVRQGLVAGDTNEEIVARVAGSRDVAGIMDISRSNARSLIHTSIQAVANSARNETYQKNADVVEGTRQVSTLDSHTTDICIAYDGAEYDLEGNPIGDTSLPYENGVPRHWGCRSVEIPITKEIEGAPVPPEGERASSDGPVPGDFTFEDYLNTRTVAQQDEQLGAGRAQMWREGTITLQQLLDLHGNPMTLDELRAKYG